MYIDASHAVDHFLRLYRSLVNQTRDFRERRHNDDLCPQLQSQVELVLRAFGRFEPVVYDTQGILDQGADVVIRVRDERRRDGDPPELLGFQIKSFGDFEQKGLLRSLKAQRDDAFRKIAGLSSYYIILCTDESKHKDTIRNVTAEFKTADRTIVIEPTYALSFLNLPERRIEGLITRMMHSDDLIFRLSLQAVNLETPTAGLLVLFLASRICEGYSHTTHEAFHRHRELESAYQSTLDARRRSADRLAIDTDETQPAESAGSTTTVVGQDRMSRLSAIEDRMRFEQEERRERMLDTFYDTFAEALAYDLEMLDGRVIDLDTHSGEVTIKRDALLPLVALLADAQVRYDLHGWDLVSYGREVLGVLEDDLT